ncbi:Dipeptide-binding ABC transporter, periplasmic substrate-binding component (TC 3.A.1.5.2) [Microbacterium esteraromaticum]|uniref:Dipeptide-binding ABC transporter, periplasmic substrate-binding component (TC 3.A.1.5.2) n=1 Tax=Microbacterium esteraromaticum TaxID=57043 RepID=A0A1R4JHY2_9MICO|nr:ABC transporter substrate-binding protein [Microbacterium esteraromaticum]SJN31363.1 Dipeptide-binding ABC transporter, periplasmic substrate-binding component (TC 3.A.1.5.2) [Microbacterium esteraromaticum]
MHLTTARRSARLAAIGILAAGALVLSACTGAPEPAPTTSGKPDPDATLTVGLVLEPTNLDIRHTSGAALEQVLVDNIYEGLLARTQDNKIEERLASSYNVSPDGLVYTFTLNPDVTFHDGAAMTSADVVASYETVKTDASVQGNAQFTGVTAITAPDAATVEIALAQPDQNFLFNLTGPGGLVFKKGDATDLKTAENGTGPFTLKRWTKGSSITFDRYDEYWGEKATLSEVVFQYIPDFTAGVNAALDGTVDVLTAVDPNLVSQLEDSGEFKITNGRTTDKATLAFNNTKAPLDDKRVREALRLAIDHEALVEAVGAGETLYGPIPELDPGYEDLSELVPFDPDKAKKLLKEAGHEKLDLTLTIPSFYGTTVAQVLISDFAKVGVSLEVNRVEFPAWLEDVYTNHDYELSFVLHVEPRDFSNFANPDYYFDYDNPKVQKLYEQSQLELDPQKSADLLKKAARIVSEDHAADWLYNGATLTAHVPGVSGFPQDSINSRINLAGVTKTAD